MNEVRRGLCGDTGAEFYGAYYCFLFFCQHDEWCSEFALWILHSVGIDPGQSLTGTDITGFVTTPKVRDEFDDHGLLWNRNAITPVKYGGHYPQAGDYLFMRGSDGSHWGHSGVVVGVSHDSRYVYTVEGNSDGHCVTYHVRDFFVDGVLHDKIDGIGRIAPWANVFQPLPGIRRPARPHNPSAPDPTCAYGILDLDSGACCRSSCGTCGGTGCGSRAGGADNCCVGRITANDLSCGSNPAGCMATDPVCAYGILRPDTGACCLSSCGTCGSTGCSGLPGGANGCCTSHISANNLSCSVQAAPCMVQ